MGNTHKNRKKTKYDTKRALIIKTLSAKYQVSDAFVRFAINGDRTSDTAESIRKEYTRLMEDITAALS